MQHKKKDEPPPYGRKSGKSLFNERPDNYWAPPAEAKRPLNPVTQPNMFRGPSLRRLLQSPLIPLTLTPQTS